MADIVSAAVRSRMMANIRGKNTKPELIVRRGLHAAGFRYRLHDKRLSGKPDLVFPKYNAVIFIHGCFWHGHQCHLFKMPSSNTVFWQTKIADNIRRDILVRERLLESDWRIATVWECSLKGKKRQTPGDVTEEIARWLSGDSRTLEIEGNS